MIENQTHTSNPTVKCIIIDDEPLAIKLIKGHIEQVPGLELIATFQNAVAALDLLKKEPVDLIFLDIQMPVLTGIDFVKSLQKPPGVIFTTAYRDYAAESYELNVIDYLIKPITFTRFFTAVNKFFNQYSTSQQVAKEPSLEQVQQSYIYVNSNKKHIKIAFDDMLYIESIKDYVRIHTADKSIVTKDKISDFEQKVPAHFLRVHRSFIVNTHKITAFTKQDIEIGDREIPIGRNYKSLVLQLLA